MDFSDSREIVAGPQIALHQNIIKLSLRKTLSTFVFPQSPPPNTDIKVAFHFPHRRK
jgi:hypothetical protein